MAEDTGLPDQAAGCAHPRDVFSLIGHKAIDQQLRESLGGPRMHHAWIIAGPRGIGKATMAYRLARLALGATPLDKYSLACSGDDPVARKIAQGAHPDLRTATRYNVEAGKAGQAIAVDTIRALTSFFELSADDRSGRRVAIIDAADEMNANAANALLKTLEEPPAGALLLLVTHAPGKLLPTIRSRCRRIDLAPVSDGDLQAGTGISDRALITMADGAPGRALALKSAGAADLYRDLSAWLARLPNAPASGIQKLAARAGSTATFPLFADLLADWLARAARAGAGLEIREIEAGESLIMARIAGGAGGEACARLWSDLQRLRGQVEGVNLDPAAAANHMLNQLHTGFSAARAA